MRFVCLPLILMLTTVAVPQTSAPESSEQQLTRLHQEFIDHYGNHNDGDVEFIRQTFLDPFVLVHKDGKIELVHPQQFINENLDERHSDPQRHVATQVQDVAVHVYGDAALVTSRYSTQVSGSNKPDGNHHVEGTDMQTWVRQGSQWKIAAMSTAGNPGTATASR